MSSDVTLAQIQSACETFGLMCQVRPDEEVVLTVLATPFSPLLTYLHLDREREVLMVRIPGVLQVPEARRGEVAQAISHINYFLVLGGFGLDLRDGELAFKLPLLYADVGLTEGSLARAFGAIIGTFEVHLPQLHQIVWSTKSAGQVLGLDMPPAPSLSSLLEALRVPEESASAEDQEESA